LPISDSRAGAFVVDGESRMLAVAIPSSFFRAAHPRSGLPGGVVVAVVGWLCLIVSMGVCSVTCGHIYLWPVIGVLTAGRAVVPTADSACCRRVRVGRPARDGNVSARGAKAILRVGREKRVFTSVLVGTSLVSPCFGLTIHRSV
jgi:hypothetical protein